MNDQSPPPPPPATSEPGSPVIDRLAGMASIVKVIAFVSLLAGVGGAILLATYTEQTGPLGSDQNPYQGLAIAVGAQAVVLAAVLYTLALVAEVVAGIAYNSEVSK